MKRIFRYAPSPTGRIHLGQVKAIVIPYFLSKKYNGEFILRIEDTDKKRNKEESVKFLIEDLVWLGIKYDKGPEVFLNDNGDLNFIKNDFFQSKRLEIYNKYIKKLLDEKKAYYAFETPEERKQQILEQRKKGNPPVYSGAHANLTQSEINAFLQEGRKHVVRVKIPKNELVEFFDEIFGYVKVNTNQIGDFVIQKSDGTPMYNFSVVVDDHEMGVTDVVRGFGHLSNTPKQILLYKIFGWDIPKFAHFSDIQNENAPGKLSKRYGAKSIHQFRAEGYLPEAIINYVVLISCSFKFQNKNEEIKSIQELIDYVDYQNILKTNAKFNAKKLEWINSQHIYRLSNIEYIERFKSWIQKYALDLNEYYSIVYLRDLISLIKSHFDDYKFINLLISAKERINKFSDIIDYLKFLVYEPNFENIIENIASTNHSLLEFRNVILNLFDLINNLSDNFSHSEWEMSIRGLADRLGWKHADLFMALRLCIVGSRFSLPLYEIMYFLGKENCLKRINKFKTN